MQMNAGRYRSEQKKDLRRVFRLAQSTFSQLLGVLHGSQQKVAEAAQSSNGNTWMQHVSRLTKTGLNGD